MPKIIAGNWKMDKRKKEAFLLMEQVHGHLARKTHQNTVIIFPPYIYLNSFNVFLKDQNSAIYTGAQNCSSFAEGAYTGEISAGMIKDIQCEYVLVGHSERRQFFHERDEELAQKITQAIENELIPIYCIGETLQERENKTYKTVLENQLINTLQNVKGSLTNLILAYEPVWAIGTGLNASKEQIAEVHAMIKQICSDKLHLKNIPVLYGGSSKPDNAHELLSTQGVDGLLIGGASLTSESFNRIIDIAETITA